MRAKLPIPSGTAKLTAWIVAALAATGCAADPPPFDDAARAAVQAAVDSATRAFEAAERARDAEAAVAHLAPDFTILVDGSRMDYEAAAAGMRATLPTLRHFEPGLDRPAGAGPVAVARDLVVHVQRLDRGGGRHAHPADGSHDPCVEAAGGGLADRVRGRGPLPRAP